MIRFSLRCAAGHEFEAWFRNGEGYEAQQAANEIACPECGDTRVEKALMAPSIGRARGAGPPMSPAQLRAALVELRRQVESHCDYVGPQFAEEARKIHYGETPDRHIYGEATPKQAQELVEEGVDVAPLPPDLEGAN